jgi:hypothetical protein
MTERHGARFWICCAVGLAAMVYGAAGFLDRAPFSVGTTVVAWVVGADLLHDLVIAPLVCVIGFVLAGRLPQLLRWPVRAAALTSAVVLVVAYPALRGFGRDTAPGNRSVQPLDYPTAVATVLAVVWGLALLWVLVAWLGQRSRPEPDPRAGSGPDPGPGPDPVPPPAPYTQA